MTVLTQLQEAAIPHRRDGVEIEHLPDGGALLTDAEREVAYPTNSMGGVIWEICDGRHSVADIADLLYELHPDAAGALNTDVQTFIQELHRNGLMSLAEPKVEAEPLSRDA